jgi:hypothetical protein
MRTAREMRRGPARSTVVARVPALALQFCRWGYIWTAEGAATLAGTLPFGTLPFD